MVESIRDITGQGVQAYPAKPRSEWVLEWPGQVRVSAAHGARAHDPGTLPQSRCVGHRRGPRKAWHPLVASSRVADLAALLGGWLTATK